MSTRTTQTAVRFLSAFSLPGFDEPQPPGEYLIDLDEESIEGVSWTAWHCVGAFIHLPAISAGRAAGQMVPIKPGCLETALEQDRNR